MDLSDFIETYCIVIRQNDLPDIRFHDLRHSCATMLLSLGFSMKAVQEQLGHTQFTTTANTYAHVYDKTKHEIADKANEALPIALQFYLFYTEISGFKKKIIKKRIFISFQ